MFILSWVIDQPECDVVFTFLSGTCYDSGYYIRIGLFCERIKRKVYKIVCVGVGGFAGAASRYLSLILASHIFGGRSFPYGTMIVNLSGCFLIGLGFGITTSREFLSPETRLLIFTGFFGSFTTYSTFAYESFALAREGGFVASALNVCLHVIFGLLAVWAGDFISRLV